MENLPPLPCQHGLWMPPKGRLNVAQKSKPALESSKNHEGSFLDTFYPLVVGGWFMACERPIWKFLVLQNKYKNKIEYRSLCEICKAIIRKYRAWDHKVGFLNIT